MHVKSWDYMDPDLAPAEELGAGRAGSIESYFSANRQAQQQLSYATSTHCMKRCGLSGRGLIEHDHRHCQVGTILALVTLHAWSRSAERERLTRLANPEFSARADSHLDHTAVLQQVSRLSMNSWMGVTAPQYFAKPCYSRSEGLLVRACC